MLSMLIVALYVGLNLILLCVLTMRVGQVRQSTKTSPGDGGHPVLFTRIRAHANYIENAPFALIGLLIVAQPIFAAPAWLLHALGGGFTFGRIAHAHGMAQKDAGGIGRVIGTLLSLVIFLVMGGFLLYKVFTVNYV